MELSNILKVQFKHLRNPLLLFNGFWALISIILFIPTKLPYDVIFAITLLLILSNIVFNIFFGNLIFGSYAKTLIQIQNNRFKYVISGLLWASISTLLLVFTTLLMKLNTYTFGFNKLNIEFVIMITLIYLTSFSLGSLYGLYLKYRKNLRKIVLFVFSFILIILGYYNLSELNNVINIIVNFNKSNFNSSIVIYLLLFNILVLLLNSIYYCKLNILKAYSPE